jgi:hypothetical protein
MRMLFIRNHVKTMIKGVNISPVGGFDPNLNLGCSKTYKQTQLSLCKSVFNLTFGNILAFLGKLHTS